MSSHDFEPRDGGQGVPDESRFDFEGFQEQIRRYHESDDFTLEDGEITIEHGNITWVRNYQSPDGKPFDSDRFFEVLQLNNALEGPVATERNDQASRRSEMKGFVAQTAYVGSMLVPTCFMLGEYLSRFGH